MYEYKAKVLNIVDGDTLDLEFDLGFDMKFSSRVRLLEIDTPEIFKPKSIEEKALGLKAKEFVEKTIPIGTSVVVKTEKDKTDKYGRYLVNIKVGDTTLSKMLLENGFVKS